MRNKKSIGILGYGSVGRFLSRKILEDPSLKNQFELVFVWNRSVPKLPLEEDMPNSIFHSGPDIEQIFQQFLQEGGVSPDLLVEVCHPAVIEKSGAFFLTHSNLLVSSITALANKTTLEKLRCAAGENSRAIYLPAGAAWGVNDIAKMGRAKSCTALSVTMTFNADALKLQDPLKSKLKTYQESELNDPYLLFEGNVRELAQLAPNNVNTMVCLALAYGETGLDEVKGALIAVKNSDAHIVEIEVKGKNGFYVHTKRHNPAKKGAVTGDETYHSFLASLLAADGKGVGLVFC